MPARGHLRHAYRLMLVVSLWFTVVFVVTDWLTWKRGVWLDVSLAAERSIPFAPGWVLLYVSLYPMLLLAPFFVRAAWAIDAMARTFAVMIGIAGMCHLLIPAALAFQTPTPAGPFAALFRLADALNLTFNLVPSLHVAFAAGVASIYGLGHGRWLRRGLWLWAAMVAASTLLTHQHHLIDVLTGWTLAIVVKRQVFDRHGRHGRAHGPWRQAA